MSVSKAARVLHKQAQTIAKQTDEMRKRAWALHWRAENASKDVSQAELAQLTLDLDNLKAEYRKQLTDALEAVHERRLP